MRPPRRRSPGLPAAPVALFALAALGGCRSTEVASVNLDELLGPDNTFRYVARIQTGYRYFVSQFLNEDWFGNGGKNAQAETVPIPDPTGTALKNLIDLKSGAWFQNETWVQAEQVRQYARYAVFCPSALARERSLLELGRFARRLGLEDPTGEPEVAANAAEIRVALEGLVEVLTRIVRGDGTLDETDRRDLQAACDLLAGLELDVEGGWRLLKVLTRFGLVTRVPAEDLAPILSLSELVQRGLVRQALAAGRADPVPLVRAAAVRSSERAYGAPFLREALLALPRGRSQLTPVYGFRAPLPDEDEVLVEVLRLVRWRGLPLHGTGPRASLERRRTRLDLLHALVQLAFDYTTFGDRVRTAAMLALAKVSGAQIDSLRERDWTSWWRKYEAAERASIDAASGVEGAGDAGKAEQAGEAGDAGEAEDSEDSGDSGGAGDAVRR